MQTKIIADLREHEQQRVAILEDGKLVEVFVDYGFHEENADSPEHVRMHSRISRLSREGDIFKARVETVLPAINAAFVALTAKSTAKSREPHNAFLYTGGNSVKPGQNIIVQIIKNARQNKAPRVSARVSVPGRWLVLVPESSELGVSRKIYDNHERKRLRALAEELKALAPGYGLVVRTAALGVDKELLMSDLKSLLELWHDIRAKAEASKVPCCLFTDTGILGRVLRDYSAGTIDEIIIDDAEEFTRAKPFIERFFPEKPNFVLYEGITPVFEYYGLEQDISDALSRKVWLNSGAYLIFDQTEALTVVDVNSGKFTSAPDMRHTILETNLEAADETARQLRLRAIGGIVVVDFIDMEEEADRNALLSRFTKALGTDRIKARVFSITQLGLIELTRKRERSDLKSLLARNCPMCSGTGFIEREENIAVRIKRFIRKVSAANNSSLDALIVEMSRNIAEYIYSYLDEWEQEFGCKIYLAGFPDYAREKFRLSFQGSAADAESRAKSLRVDSGGKIIIFRT